MRPRVFTDLAEMVRAARNEAMSTALPEQRLAKIFAAMSPKDAAWPALADDAAVAVDPGER